MFGVEGEDAAWSDDKVIDIRRALPYRHGVPHHPVRAQRAE